MSPFSPLTHAPRLIESESTTGFNSTFFQALAFDHDLGGKRGIDAALKAHNLDALVLPAPGFTTAPAGTNTSQLGVIVTNLLQPSLDILS
jgi:hypothetical protein